MECVDCVLGFPCDDPDCVDGLVPLGVYRRRSIKSNDNPKVKKTKTNHKKNNKNGTDRI